MGVVSLAAEKSSFPVGLKKVNTKFVAIASGKGGVGKTWLSVSLAQALAKSGCRILVLDGDFSLANVDLQLGLMPKHDLVDLFSGKVPLKDVLQSCTLRNAKTEIVFDVLPGRSGLAGLSGMDQGKLDHLLFSLRLLRTYDIVLIDLCAGLDDTTRRMSAFADILLAVTTEEPTALADVYAMMKIYMKDRRQVGGDVTNCHVVVNQVMSHRSGQQTFEKLRHACHSFLKWDVELMATVRKDTRVPTAIRQQSSLMMTVPSSPSSVDVHKLAERVGRLCGWQV